MLDSSTGHPAFRDWEYVDDPVRLYVKLIRCCEVGRNTHQNVRIRTRRIVKSGDFNQMDSDAVILEYHCSNQLVS